MSKLDNNVERRERLKRVRRPHGKERDPLSISFYYLHFLLAVRAPYVIHLSRLLTFERAENLSKNQARDSFRENLLRCSRAYAFRPSYLRR